MGGAGGRGGAAKLALADQELDSTRLAPSRRDGAADIFNGLRPLPPAPLSFPKTEGQYLTGGCLKICCFSILKDSFAILDFCLMSCFRHGVHTYIYIYSDIYMISYVFVCMSLNGEHRSVRGTHA